MRFPDLSLIQPLVRAIAEEGYETPTPVQAQAIPHVLAGRDLLAIAQTGTGKTAAFALPVLQRLAKGHASDTRHADARRPGARPPIRALVLVPTRELASQVGEAFEAYGRYLPFRTTVVFGGVPQGPQARAIHSGVDVLVATPGRLLDLIDQRVVSFGGLEVLVLDEADRMLDMGFLPAVRRVLAVLPRRRQTLFFSATMSREPQSLADAILHDAARVAVTPQATTVEKVSQSVYLVEKSDKQRLLEHLLRGPEIARALVFTRTKHGANRVAQRLSVAGFDTQAIHANKSQSQRERALAGFRAGVHRVLVATDIAARGIDVDDITHVVNFDLPNIPESYVHRIGRTARAGATGAAISFCDGEERAYLRDIEREIRMRVPVVADHPFARGSRRPQDEMPAASSHPHAQNAAPPAAWIASDAPSASASPAAPPPVPARSHPHRPTPSQHRGPRQRSRHASRPQHPFRSNDAAPQASHPGDAAHAAPSRRHGLHSGWTTPSRRNRRRGRR